MVGWLACPVFGKGFCFSLTSFVCGGAHAFCFACVVMAASMTGNVCPLCKVKFFKVIHNVRDNDDYDIVSY